MSAKHTPGPWRQSSEYPEDVGISPSDTGELVQLVACAYLVREGEFGDQFANARLIAAAPQMLEALKVMRDAVAGAMRVLHSHGIVEPFVKEMARIGIPNGFGKAADDLIAQVEVSS